MIETNRQRIEHIARRLESLLDEMVFVGGATTELLITVPYIQDIRATKDVDLIVDVLTRVEYYKLSDRLRTLGFQEKAGDHPICRWTMSVREFRPFAKKLPLYIAESSTAAPGGESTQKTFQGYIDFSRYRQVLLDSFESGREVLTVGVRTLAQWTRYFPP